MTLSTYTLDRMREREERKRAVRMHRLVHAERGLESAMFPDDQRRLRAQISATRRSMTQLITQRSEMEQVAHDIAEGQIADFNTRYGDAQDSAPWDAHFRRMDELPAETRSKIWKSLPSNLLFRRVQDVFVRPENRIIPRSFKDREQFGIAGISLDPECVTDDLAVELGLVTFPEDSTPVERWRLKHTPEFVAQLRNMLACAHPLTKGNRRVLVLPDGRILYFSENVHANGDPHRPPLKASLFADVYDALRKTHHAGHLYERERKTVEGIRTRLSAQITPRIDEWRSATPQEEKKRIADECLPQIAKCAEELENCTDVLKRIAGDTLTGIRDFTVERKDGARVVNPSVAMSQITKAGNRLAGRLDRATEKSDWNEHDRADIEREITRSERVFSQIRERLQTATPEDAADHARASRFNGLRGMRASPFKEIAEKILAIRERELGGTPAADALGRGLVKILNVLKYQSMHQTFEELKVKMLAMEHLGVTDLQTCIEELDRIFTPIDIFPEVRVQEYVQPFEDMCAALQTIKKGLAHYASQPLTREERLALFRRFRSYLDTFDIPAIVNALPVNAPPTPSAEVL